MKDSIQSIIFFGTDLFATHILSALLFHGKKVVAVVTKGDKAKERGGKVLPPPVKKFLLEHYPNIPLFQPEKASTPEFASILRSFTPDLFVVVSYGEIISEALLAIPKQLPINIHPSFLPKYRGASPLRSAILEGDKEIGVAIIEMVKKMDAGDILKMGKLKISEKENHSDIEKKMFIKAEALLLECLEECEQNCVSKMPQKGEVTFTKKVTKGDEWIDWTQSVDTILNHIRAFGDVPGAITEVELEGKRILIKILRGEKYSSDGVAYPQTVGFSKKEGWLVGCKDGVIRICRVQPESKKSMNVQDFINGARNKTPIVIVQGRV